LLGLGGKGRDLADDDETGTGIAAGAMGNGEPRQVSETAE
jgi:hypothetical protein